MSHSVLFLGGPLDGTRAEVDELLEYHWAVDWAAVPKAPIGRWCTTMAEVPAGHRVKYTLEKILDGESSIVHYLYVREGLNTLAQLLHGYREARS